MGFLDRLLGRRSPKPTDPDAPFMEHPTGRFESALDAMADAIKRLRELAVWNDWITFCAQGRGHDADSEHSAEIRMRQNDLQCDQKLNVESIIQFAGVPRSCLVEAGASYSLVNASPTEAARIMDAIFRHALDIRPHEDEENDYAVGAEW